MSRHAAHEGRQPPPQARALSEVPLYHGLDEQEVEELNRLLGEVTFQAGETIFYEDDPGDAAYIVRSGAVRIWTHDEDQREVTLARLEPYEFFGEMAVLDGSPRSANAGALEETRLGRLSREDMHSFLLAHPSAALVMIQEIARRLRQTNRIVAKRVTRNVNVEMEQRMTPGQRVADRIASLGGSWAFIVIYCVLLLAINAFVLTRLGSGTSEAPFDPFPYILLNLALSLTAALLAPIILMSQNRAQQKARLAAENDFRVNLKNELLLEELTRRMDRLQNDQFEELTAAVRRMAGREAAGDTRTGLGDDGQMASAPPSPQAGAAHDAGFGKSPGAT